MKRILFILTFIILNSSFFPGGAGILNAQVGINTDNTDPDASAMPDVKSTDKGMLIPRMTTTQRTAISNPANGLLVFDATTNSFWFYKNSTWEEIRKLTEAEVDALVNNNGYLTTGVDGDINNEIQTLSINGQDLSISNGNTIALPTASIPNQISDADNDTKIQVEETADEDKIRFDVNGTEAMIIDMNGKVGIDASSPNTKVSISPSTIEPKITLWDGGGSTKHYGFGISGGQLNYNVPATDNKSRFHPEANSGQASGNNH